MKTLVPLINDSEELVHDIRHHAEGFDPELLLEVLLLTDADFTEPVEGETLLAQLADEGYL